MGAKSLSWLIDWACRALEVLNFYFFCCRGCLLRSSLSHQMRSSTNSEGWQWCWSCRPLPCITPGRAWPHAVVCVLITVNAQGSMWKRSATHKVDVTCGSYGSIAVQAARAKDHDTEADKEVVFRPDCLTVHGRLTAVRKVTGEPPEGHPFHHKAGASPRPGRDGHLVLFMSYCVQRLFHQTVCRSTSLLDRCRSPRWCFPRPWDVVCDRSNRKERTGGHV